MKTFLISTLVLSLGFAACKGTDGATSKPSAMMHEGYESFGAGVESLQGVAAAEVLANPAKYDGKEVRVTGDIHSVCVKKGCWMRIGSELETATHRLSAQGMTLTGEA